MARLRSAPGFTLIELLVVVLIIGILIAASAPSFLGQTQKAHDSAAKQYLSVAYRAAKAGTVDRDGDYGSAAQVVSDIQASEPELDVVSGSCPTDTTGDPKHIVVDSAYTGVAHADDLLICNDPTHTVWYLKVDHGGPVQIYSDEQQSSSGGSGSGDGPAVNDSSTPPPNDNFTAALVISGASGSAEVVNNALATTEDGENLAPEETTTCSGGPSSTSCPNPLVNTVWYKWTAPAAGDYLFDTAQSLDTNPDSGDVGYSDHLDTVLAAYQGTSLAGLAEVAGNDEDPTSTSPISPLTSLIALTGVQAGDVYYIQVGSYDFEDPPSQAWGEVHLHWKQGTFHIPVTPALQSSPFISGTPQEGQTLTADHGSWTGASSYAYQWARCDTSPYQNTGCVDIAGATGTTYHLVRADVGLALSVFVTATSADNLSASGGSTETLPIAALQTSQMVFPGEPNGTYRSSERGLIGTYLDGSGPRQISDPGGSPSIVSADNDPVFSPDKSQIAFDRLDAVNDVDKVMVSTPDSMSATEIYSISSQYANIHVDGWSPDGSKILFQAPDPNTGGFPAIFVVGADGSNPHVLIDRLAVPGGSHGIYTGRYSADGAHIVSMVLGLDGSQNIWKFDADGSNPLELTSLGAPTPNQINCGEGATVDDPSFLADGTVVFQQSTFPGTKTSGVCDDQYSEIWAMNADGSNQHRIIGTSTNEARSPRVTTDGKLLYFSFSSDFVTFGTALANTDGSGSSMLVVGVVGPATR